MTETIEKVISWGRYLYWAELARAELDELFESNEEDSKKTASGIFFARISQWYSSLWVVIEGWKALKLSDTKIDSLLDEHNELVSLLRRFRNGVFHYQPDLINQRFMDFFHSKDGTSLWIRILHEQFVRFFSDWLASFHCDSKLKNEIETSVEEIIGWIPKDTFSNRVRSLSAIIKQAEQLLHNKKDKSSSAKKLRKAILLAAEISRNTQRKYEEYFISKKSDIQD